MPPNDIPLEIDIVIGESLEFDNIAKRKVIKSIDDLLKMKRKANRTNDIMDIEALLKLKGL